MGQAYLMRKGGKGNGLRAVSCASADKLPTLATKNRLAVISDIKSIYVYVQAERPEVGEAGDVWAKSVSGDDISVYTTRSSLEVGIKCVEQYDGTQWKRMEAYIYDGEAWRNVSTEKVLLYENGVTNAELVTGWTERKGNYGVIEWNEDHLYLGYTGSVDRYASVYTGNTIDLTNYSKIVAVVSETTGSGTGTLGAAAAPYTGVSQGTGREQMAAYVSIPSGVTEKTTYELDISALEGTYVIQLMAGIWNGTFYEIYLN